MSGVTGLSTSKRKGVSDELTLTLYSKKLRTEVALTSSREKAVVQSGLTRTSNLMAPIMAMEGHQGEIFACAFHPEGQYLASAGFDRLILLWKVYGECDNVGMMTGHTGAITRVHFSTDGSVIYSSSTDNTLGIWDLESGVRIKKLKGHASFVNDCYPARRGPALILSASDDCTLRVWDARRKDAVTILSNTYQITACTFNDTADQAISSGIDNDLKIWDLRQNALLFNLKGHTDTVTGLSLSADGSYVLSNAMDNYLRIWDVRPFAPQERCVKIFAGQQHNFERNLLRCCWSADGSKISAGSADRFLYVWDTTSRRILYKLPGHNGSINDVAFHPTEPIILSASSDKTLYMGELE